VPKRGHRIRRRVGQLQDRRDEVIGGLAVVRALRFGRWGRSQAPCNTPRRAFVAEQALGVFHEVGAQYVLLLGLIAGEAVIGGGQEADQREQRKEKPP
jgi:hypothetical protein